jgi:hypothetical protein
MPLVLLKARVAKPSPSYLKSNSSVCLLGESASAPSQLTGIGEDVPTSSHAWARRDHARRQRIVEREDLKLGRLHHEQLLHLPELAWIGSGEVVVLGPVLGQVGEFPLVAVHHVRVGRRDEQPRRADRVRVGVPAVLGDATICTGVRIGTPQ